MNVSSGRPRMMPITVRTKWKADEPSCNLMVGYSNVLITEVKGPGGGPPQRTSPVIPERHAFFLEAFEVVVAREHEPWMLENAEFRFDFSSTNYINGAAAMVLNRRHDVLVLGKPLELMSYECLNASLRAATAPKEGIPLVFLMHGILVREDNGAPPVVIPFELVKAMRGKSPEEQAKMMTDYLATAAPTA